jgi:hypothetical protein
VHITSLFAALDKSTFITSPGLNFIRDSTYPSQYLVGVATCLSLKDLVIRSGSTICVNIVFREDDPHFTRVELVALSTLPKCSTCADSQRVQGAMTASITFPTVMPLSRFDSNRAYRKTSPMEMSRRAPANRPI